MMFTSKHKASRAGAAVLFAVLLFLPFIPQSHALLTDGLSHYWRVNDGNLNTTDQIGTWNLSHVNANPNVAGKTGLGVQLLSGILYQEQNTIMIHNTTICFWQNYLTNGNVRHWEVGNNNRAPSYTFWAVDDQAGTPTLFLDAAGQTLGTDISTGEYIHLCYRIQNTTGVNLEVFVNGDWNRSADVGGTTWRNMSVFSLGARLYNGGLSRAAANISFDEIAYWDRNLSNAEILQVYNLQGDDLTYIADERHSIIDMLFTNETDRSTYKTVFDEGEEFLVYVNWTVNGTAQNASNGTCNLTLFDALIENKSTIENYTICTSGCNFTSLTEELKQVENESSVNDSYRIEICHDGLALGDVTFNISCKNGHSDHTILAEQFLLCTEPYQTVVIEDDVCTNRSFVNYTITTTATNPKAKRILEIDFDREFSEHVHEYPAEVIFNETTSLWQILTAHEYYKQGQKKVDANCSHVSSVEYDNSTTEYITIVNRPPEIVFGVIVNALASNVFTNNTGVEFAAGNWSLIGGVIDDDLTTLMINLSNATHTIYNDTTNLTAWVLNFNSTVFDSFTANPYRLYIWANDSGGNVTEAFQYFNVTDFTNPVCINLPVITFIYSNETFDWDVYCSDQNFFSFEMNCTDGYYFYEDGLNVPAYHFVNSTQNDSNFTCAYRYCDGHTDVLSRDWATRTDDKSFEFESFDGITSLGINRLEIIDDINVSLAHSVEEDRVLFNISFDKDIPTTMNLIYSTSGQSYHFPSTEYRAWIVDSGTRTWFDLNDEYSSASMTVRRWNATAWQITVKDIDVREIQFQSIGELNCISGSQVVIVSERPAINETFIIGECPSDTPQMLLLIFFMVLAVIIFVISLGLRSVTGSVLGIVSGIFLFITSWVVVGCYALLGYMVGALGIIFVSIGIFGKKD